MWVYIPISIENLLKLATISYWSYRQSETAEAKFLSELKWVRVSFIPVISSFKRYIVLLLLQLLSLTSKVSHHCMSILIEQNIVAGEDTCIASIDKLVISACQYHPTTNATTVAPTCWGPCGWWAGWDCAGTPCPWPHRWQWWAWTAGR